MNDEIGLHLVKSRTPLNTWVATNTIPCSTYFMSRIHIVLSRVKRPDWGAESESRKNVEGGFRYKNRSNKDLTLICFSEEGGVRL